MAPHSGPASQGFAVQGSLPRSKVWGRWLRIALLVGFVLDVLLAIRCHAFRQGLPPEAFLPVSQPRADLMHVPPGECLAAFAASVLLFVGWVRAAARELGTSGPIVLLFGDARPWLSLPALEFGPSAWQLAMSWRVLVPATLGGWLLLVSWTLIYRPGPSIAGLQLEMVLAILICLCALISVGLIEVVDRRGPTAVPSTSAAPPGLPRSAPRPLAGTPTPAPGVPLRAPRLQPQASRGASAPAPMSVAATPDVCLACGASSVESTCRACGATRSVRGFRVEQVLATRPHGWTYLVRDPGGARAVLKEVRLSRTPDVKVIDAFQREAALLRALRVPGIPAFLDSFEIAEAHDVRLFLAMEWIEGRSLRDALARGPLPESAVRRIVIDVLRLLVTLHERDVPIVHRDIKPSNLLQQRTGRIALVDFGVARDLIGRTADATLVGTVGYMPPEQLAGQVDATSDLYALGVTAMTLLTGREPAELLTKEAVLAIPRLPVTRTFGKVLRRLAAPRPRQRFPSARKALEALGEKGRSLRGPVVVATLLLVAGALGVGLWLRYRGPPAPASGVAIPAPRAAFEPVLPTPPEKANVATFPGGAVTMAEYRQEVQSIPPSFRTETLAWQREVVEALSTLKQLAAAARAAGVPSTSRHDRGTLLTEARALGVREGVFGKDRPAKERWSSYRQWLERHVRKATIDDELLRANPVKAVPPPSWLSFRTRETPFVLDLDAVTSCDGMLHPDGWYEAACPPGLDFGQLFPPELLQAELSIDPAVPFVHTQALGSAPNFRVLLTAGTQRSADLAPPAEPDDLGPVFPISLRDISVEGSIRRENAQLVWDRVQAPFLRCFRSFLWANRHPGPEADVTLRLRIDTGRATTWSGSLDDSALGRSEYTRWSAYPCTSAFTDWLFPDPGSGTVTYKFHVKVAGAH